MTGKQITKYFLMILIAVVIIFDVVIIKYYGKGSSISWFVIKDIKKEWPLINDGFWFVMGHLFWSMKTPKGETRG